MARGRSAVDDDFVKRLDDHVIDDSSILDLVTECAIATLVGVVDNLAGHVTLDEFLQPFAWQG